VPTVHPVVAAKQCVTVDHISNGRFGLNLVMGWFTSEMEMFGAVQREHDERYAFGGEWIGVVKRRWTDEKAFDFDGKNFRICGSRGCILQSSVSVSGMLSRMARWAKSLL
jgi:alkanesulfonate monooxygenase SsuD/methylene tetrahydromethanopterin reductase-like flavin-dependent oxidoreductase (luciferase family)